MSEGACTVLDAIMAFLEPFVLFYRIAGLLVVVSTHGLRNSISEFARHQTNPKIKNPYLMISREQDYHHVMIYMPKPALRFPRAVDVPSALSIVMKDRRDLMLDVSRKRCLSAQHTSGQAPHGHLYVRPFVCKLIRFLCHGLQPYSETDLKTQITYALFGCVLNPVWYMHALK
jgi:hypothetical protein